MLAGLIYSSLHAVGVTALARRVRNAGVVLCYHNVVPPTVPGEPGAPGMHLSLERFSWQMRWLAAHYAVLPLSEFVDRLLAGEPMRRIASVTFDDAYGSVFEHAWPVMRQLGITPTVFVIAGAPGRRQRFWWDHPAVRYGDARVRSEWLTRLHGDGEAILGSVRASDQGEPIPAAHLPAGWAVIAEAARGGVELGLHSATHRALPTLTDDELIEEVQASRAVVVRETGATPTCFAFPYGLWDERVRRCVRQAGYRAALTLDYGLVAAGADPWSLPRVNVPSGMSDSAYRAWAAGLCLRQVFGS